MDEAQAAAAMGQKPRNDSWLRTATDYLDRMAGRYWKGTPQLEKFYAGSIQQGKLSSMTRPPRNYMPANLHEYYSGLQTSPMPQNVARHWVGDYLKSGQFTDPQLAGELPWDASDFGIPGSYGGYGGGAPIYVGGGGGGGRGGGYKPGSYLDKAYAQQDWGAQVEQEQRGYGEAQQMTLWNI